MTSTTSPDNLILQVEDLTVAYRLKDKWLEAVRDVSLSIHGGETYGLVGESGSGKTTLILAVMRYLSENGVVRQGKITLAGRDLLALDQREMHQVWGRQMALVPQNSQSSLNPSLRLGEQLVEALRCNSGLDARHAYQRAIDLFEMVHLADPQGIAQSYPHQISGGMQQRVLIAMALSSQPQLLILDEPTTGLDVTTQAVILDLVGELIEGRKTAVLYVTHNLGVVAQVCDRVAVMYAGELVEDAPVENLFHNPLHPYTLGLLGSVPRLGETKGHVHLRAIQGQIPALGERPSGCVFQPRCPLAVERCNQRPSLQYSATGRVSRCHRWQEIDQGEKTSQDLETGISALEESEKQLEVLALKDVAVHLPVRRSPVEVLRQKSIRKVKAVNQVNLNLARGKTLGLVGESGSGKTTLANAIMGLVEKTGGVMELLGAPLPSRLSGRQIETLRHLQIIFQNPEEALNPYLTVGESLRRPLVLLLGKSGAEADGEVVRLLEAVQLPACYAQRLPAQLSGGELQRVAIARAFASHPELLVCDEPLSALDVSIQAAILKLLSELQSERGDSLLFISHDLAVVGYLADEVAVIYLGHLMEVAKAGDIFRPPYHPYTEALLSAIPINDPCMKQKRIRLEGEAPSPSALPPGCPFHTRCPRSLGERCATQTPAWQEVEPNGKRLFCHIPADELRAMQKDAISLAQSTNG